MHPSRVHRALGTASPVPNFRDRMHKRYGMNPILRKLCTLPTAPFREHAVIDFVRGFASRHRLGIREDVAGNILLQSRRAAPRWVLVAHMDHPGLIAGEKIAGRRIRAVFHGGVRASHMRGVPVVFYDGPRAVRGAVVSAKADDRGTATSLVAIARGRVAPGAPGMFDFHVARQRGTKLHSRSLDDTAGVAAALQVLLNSRRRRSGPAVAVLLTRAEEVGFIGAIAAAREARLLRKSDLIVSIECSAMQPYAPQGSGVVIRVGDKTSVFDWGLTYSLAKSAEAMVGTKRNFQFQRALMPGGTCEATAFGVYGFRAGAVCIPLGNYHNMVPGKRALAAEYIDLNDWQSLVELLTHATAVAPISAQLELRKGMEKRYMRHRRDLREPRG